MRALLVTETPAMETSLRAGLMPLGVDVRVAETLTEAARVIAEACPDAIIMDLRWSISWGMSIIGWIERNVAHRDIPIILSAQTPMARDLRSVVRLRRATFLPRDFQASDLAEAIGLRTPATVA